MIKVAVILIFLVHNLVANNYNLTLVEFADKVSKQNDINIVIDEQFRNLKISLLIPDKISNKELFKMFEKTVNKNKFNIFKSGSTYYLSKKIKYASNSYLYKLKYNTFRDCELIFKTFDIKYLYLQDLNAFSFKTDKFTYSKLISVLNDVDIKKKQVMLKIMIFEYADSLTNERGIQYGSIYKGIDSSIQTALNTIIAPITTNNPTLLSADFYGAVRLLNEDKEITVKQNPFILAKNNKSFKFEAVENKVYLERSTRTEATNVSEENSYKYKDIGLKINGKTFIHQNYITLDIDLIIEDLLNGDTDNLTPETYKRVLKSNTNIGFNQVLLLSGLKRNRVTKNDWSIPYLSNIPYLGELFKYKTKSNETINITIAIEVINKASDSL